MTKEQWKEHQKTCPICFWLLAVWRCKVGAEYLKSNNLTYIKVY